MNNDTISREAIKKTIVEMLEKWADGYSYIEIPTDDAIKQMKSVIDNAPTVEANSIIDGLNNEIDDLSENLAWYINERNRLLKERRPQGEWKFVFDDKVNNRFIYKCSECGREVSVYSSDALIPVYPFCHCGAKMQKGGAENDK